MASATVARSASIGFSIVQKSAAVTGAGGGIGRSLCLSLAREGAKAISALDLSLEGAEETAHLVAQKYPSCIVTAARCDASDRAQLQASLTSPSIPPVDIFCSNAGVALGGDCSSPDASWDLSWRLHVMQLKWGAEALLPSLLSRGSGGAFLVTASAAGLLQQPGSAPYSATKHAAVGLAEWLAMTHGDWLTVTCLCPQGVDTQMIRDIMEQDEHPSLRVAAADGVLRPEDVADEAIEALKKGQFLCMPGGARGPKKHTERKAADRERWLISMRRLDASYREPKRR
jgi:NAD(P)-dependent dehydrogenase (short-subunit alcohol dehydrogenase family)